MLVFDRLAIDTEPSETPLHLPSEPPQDLLVSASAMDAFAILSDLCLHTAASSGNSSIWGAGEKEKPRILKLGGLQRTFGLELIESILGGYEQDIKAVSMHRLGDGTLYGQLTDSARSSFS